MNKLTVSANGKTVSIEQEGPIDIALVQQILDKLEATQPQPYTTPWVVPPGSGPWTNPGPFPKPGVPYWQLFPDQLPQYTTSGFSQVDQLPTK